MLLLFLSIRAEIALLGLFPDELRRRFYPEPIY